MAATGDFAFATEYRAVLQQLQQSKQSRTRAFVATLRRKMTLQNCYVFFTVLSFLTAMTLGSYGMSSLRESCTVYDPNTLCCRCLKAPWVHRGDGDVKSLFVGLVLVTQSFFGILYIWRGVLLQNKFLLSCTALTQILVIVSAGFDLLMNRKERSNSVGQQDFSFVVWGFACLMLLLSLGLIRPVYKRFGWLLFRRGGTSATLRRLLRTFELFHAFILLDIQLSVALLLLQICFLKMMRSWAAGMLVATDTAASIFLLMYLKREVFWGAVLSAGIKLLVMLWWVAAAALLFTSYFLFLPSVQRTEEWLRIPLPFDDQSVKASYEGLWWISPDVSIDQSTGIGVGFITLMAFFFRCGALIQCKAVSKNFGRGLRDCFYPTRRATKRIVQVGTSEEVDEEMEKEGHTADVNNEAVKST